MEKAPTYNEIVYSMLTIDRVVRNLKNVKVKVIYLIEKLDREKEEKKN